MKNKSIEREISPNSSNLYFIFGGIAAGIAMPPFEFYHSSKIINENKIFIRDLKQCWYHSGLSGISNDIPSTARFISKEIQRYNPKRVFFVGNSMGGYAAILFTALIGYGNAIAFAPQTFINPILRLKYNDNRWAKQIFNTYKCSLFKKKAWDLKPFLLKCNNNQKISIFVAKDHQLDYIHAQHLRHSNAVKIYDFKSGGHEIVKVLRNSGKLASIMSGSYK